MGFEHEPETVWRAQELYCVDRLAFEAVARETGVAASTLKRWSEKYGWQAKREEIAQAEADIRADKVLARSAMLKTLITKKEPQAAFAVASLETLALKEAELARLDPLRQRQQMSDGQSPPDAALSLQAATAAVCDAQGNFQPSLAISALRRAVEQKLGLLLTRPENVDLRAVQEVQKCLALVGQLEAAQSVATPESVGTEGGLPADFVEQIRLALTGGAAPARGAASARGAQ